MEFSINQYTSTSKPTENVKNNIAHFLFHHLEEYGDKQDHILKAIEYAVSDEAGKGGAVFVAFNEEEIVGAVVINHTGMQDYIPENILVYIATHGEYRGNGIGSKLLKYVIENTPGNIALHVEKNNPAKKLYEKFGFTNPYLEMRLIK